MTDIICPLCGKPNPPDREECMYCQAPLKSSGFLFPDIPDEETPQTPPPEKPAEEAPQTPEISHASSLEQAVPDWLKETEAKFLNPTEPETPESQPEEPQPDEVSDEIDALLNQASTTPADKTPAIDDDWLASLLEEAGMNKTVTETSPEDKAEGPGLPTEEPPSPLAPAEKPDWLSELEATSNIKLEGVEPPAEPGDVGAGEDETKEEPPPETESVPDWVGKPEPATEETPPAQPEPGAPPIASAELPAWLEALRPKDAAPPTEPPEDLSAADMVTAGPLVGLRGVISAHPSAIRARKPPTYSIKLRVTDEQNSRVEMMKELLANEQLPKPLPTQPIITSRNITRLVIAVVLILPIVWMVITGSQRVPPPQPGTVPGVVDFTQQIQKLPPGAPVLIAFDYEAGFSGEMNTAISTLVSQLMVKNAYMAIVTTTPSGPALAESMIRAAASTTAPYSNYADLGYVPGGTLGLLGLATSPKTVVPYALDGSNVWAGAPLNAISTVKDFSAVIVLTNDSAIARSWIEQVGPYLKESSKPLLVVTSAQAEPLILPYYLGTPAQVQGLVTGLVGGLAYARTVGNIQQNGAWDAFSLGVTAAVAIILVGSIVGMLMEVRASESKKES